MADRIDISDVVTRVMRDHPGLTYDELGDAAGVSGRQVSRWVAGDSVPPTRKVVRALEQLEISPKKYGLRSPTTSRTDSSSPPAWARVQHEQIVAHLQTIEDKLDRLLSAGGPVDLT